LFIDGKQGLYIQKGEKGSDQEKRIKLKRRKSKGGNENNGSLFGMTYITWRERQTKQPV